MEVGGWWSPETRSFFSQLAGDSLPHASVISKKERKQKSEILGGPAGGSLGDPRLCVCQAPNAFICVSSSVSILGPFWVHFGSILGPFWVHFGSILGPFWVHFGTILGPFCLLSE